MTQPSQSRGADEPGEPAAGLIHSFRVLPELGSILSQTYTEWLDKKASRLGAALAYYTIFSLAPLLVVVIAVAGLVFGEAAVEGRVVAELSGLVGVQGGIAIQNMLKAAHAPAQGVAATIGSVIALILGASAVVSELRDALDTLWEIPVVPSGGFWASILDVVKRRLFAFTLVMGIGFLLLISLIANAAVAALGKYFQSALPMPEHVLEGINFLVSFVVITFVFGLIYKILPDAGIAWSEVLVGAAMTSLLFSGGQLLISLYLGKSSLGSAYGAAGSLVVLLAWVYYSAQVFLFGAAFTRVYSLRLQQRAR